MNGKILNTEVLDGLQEALGDRLPHVLQVFLEESPKSIQSMQEACDAEDFEKVRILVHSLKSSSASVGAMNVSELAAALEQKINAADTSNAAQELIEIKKSFDQVQPMFSDYL